MPSPGRSPSTNWRSGSGRNVANVGVSTPVTSIGITIGGSGWSTPSPLASSEAVIQAMSAVAVVVAVTSGTVLTRSPNPDGNPPGTHASHASGVGAATEVLGDGPVEPVGSAEPGSERPPNHTTVDPMSATPTNVTRPRVSARRSSASMSVRESTAVPGVAPGGSAGGGVLQEPGEPLGPARRLARPARVHCDGDRAQLALDRGRDPRGACTHERVELGDGVVEAVERRPGRGDVVAIGLERDDVSHVSHLRTAV